MILKLHLDVAELDVHDVYASVGVCVFSSVTLPVGYF